MNSIVILFLVLVQAALLMPSHGLAASEETGDKSQGLQVRSASEMMKELKQRSSKGELSTPDVSAYMPKVWCANIDDEATKAICWKAYQASLNYYETGLQHRTRVFWWQHMSTRIILFVVLVLVASGIYFAWIQFKLDVTSRQSTRSTESGKEHSLELSTSGIKVSSPVLGVIILALSLAFFYLYLIYVYPITEVF